MVIVLLLVADDENNNVEENNQFGCVVFGYQMNGINGTCFPSSCLHRPFFVDMITSINDFFGFLSSRIMRMMNYILQNVGLGQRR